MSKRRKKNSTNPKRDRLREARRQWERATRIAEREPTHENLTRAFALAHAVKLIEAVNAREDES